MNSSLKKQQQTNQKAQTDLCLANQDFICSSFQFVRGTAE